MQDIIRTLHQALAPHHDEREARAITDLLLEEVCGITRIDRIMHPERRPTPSQHAELMRCAGMLAKGHPVQQALGYEWFCGQRFRVTPDVLIPRPETAELIGWIAATAPASPDGAPIRILDMGTGSGCIAITLARLINNSQALAIDLSTAALDVARLNAREQGVDNVLFAQCDILRSVDNSYFRQAIQHLSATCQHPTDTVCQHALSSPYQQESADCQHDTFDVIVSNPPYICQREAQEMSPVVLDHEPALALFVPDDDPLLFYRAIARFAMLHLSAQGQLFFEINAAYGPHTCQMLSEEGFVHTELRQDINGRDRMIRAMR